MTIDVVECLRSVEAVPCEVGEATDAVKVRRCVERLAVRNAEPHTGEDLGEDRLKCAVLEGNWGGCSRDGFGFHEHRVIVGSSRTIARGCGSVGRTPRR